MEPKNYVIKQISIFSENKPGRLAAIAKALQGEKINILAFSIAEADGFGVVRALVDNPQKAFEKLSKLGFNVAFTDVIAVKMQDEPGGLYEIAQILGEGMINIEYSYAYSGKDAAVLILRVDNVDAAITAITKGG
ncbi:MAG: acetolactate synthase, partial [Methanoregulaceae archaeon]|nr:acetolactate synthase [Methanoregulaceae archaeon]